MEYNIIKKTTCKDSLKCADNIREKIENEFNIKLMARNDTDIVNGFITIQHEENNHKILVCLYDKNEESNKEHKTTFKKTSKNITKDSLKKTI